MSIQKSKFPNRILVLPNAKYVFVKGQTANDYWKVIRTFDCAGMATVYITSIGTFGFMFPDSSDLASIDVLKFCGQGNVPEKVTENDDAIHILQEKRMLFINFISAVFWGRVSANKHTSLVGALYNGQDKIAAFDIVGNTVCIQSTKLISRIIKEKVDTINIEKSQSYFLKDNDIDDAISYIQHLLVRQNDFEYADLQSCMVMNYQAAILHSQQHAAASLVLNFSVIESLVREIFMAYGLVANSTIKSFATKQHSLQKISKKNFVDMKVYKAIETLCAGGLLDDYLYNRLDSARKKRNNLMHKGEIIDPRDSGDCQTLVRDLWTFLIDTPFELNAAWSYRR
ncbi:MAG: hypothetical protein HQ522_05920 [Bacteroidetes bacterium]|nr:hypothetical protein [Bacteroidota bacterium]